MSFSVLSGIFDVNSPDTRELIVHIRNLGDHEDTIGVYVEATPPAGGGCQPSGRFETTVTLKGRGEPDESGTAKFEFDFFCTNQSAVVGESYTFLVVVDSHNDDSEACTPIQTTDCTAALADDDDDKDNNELSTSRPRIKEPRAD